MYAATKQGSSAVDLKCHICGAVFLSEQEKQKHVELEHRQNQRPTGVG